MRNHLSMIGRLVVMLGAVLWTFWFIPAAFAGSDEAQAPPPEDQSRLKSASEQIEQTRQRAQDSPKQFKDYFHEKVAQAETEPWRETADEILIDSSQVRWHRYLRSLANTPEWLDMGLTHRLRYESLTNNFRKDQDENISGLALRTRLRVGADWKMFRVLVEAQNSSDVADQGGIAGTLNNSLLSTDRLLQGFLAIKLDNVFATGLRTDLHLGRMTMDFGARRLIARNEFRNTTNTFEGIHWNLAEERVWRTRAFVVKPVAETFGVLEPVSDTLFWGVQYEDRRQPWIFLDLYYFGINGGESQGRQRTLGTYGIRYFRSAEVNQLDYEGESAFQNGTRSGLDHFAHLQHFQVGYTFDLPMQPRVMAMYDYASGTSDPNSGKSGTFDTLFGARRPEYTPTSIFWPFFRSNISSPGIRLEMQTSRDIDLTLKWRAWWLAQSKDAWVGSGLQDPTGAAGNYLGQDVEIRARWRWGTFWTFDVGYDHFFKGSYIRNLAQIPGNPTAKDSDYFYFQTEFRF
jgi:Alginate export